MSDDRVFAKCAWRLLPFMMLLYVVNFIDRANVAFAALTMNKDLSLSPTVFGFGAGIFFVSFSLFEVPANVILSRVGARRWMFCIMATWGAISAAGALVQGPASFYGLRFLLGVAESGFFPGMIFYLTLWFPQAYRARFTANFMASIPLSFVIGSPLSGLILGMDGTLGLHGWQWLFVIEGVPACILALGVLKFLPDGPAGATWLTSDEKKAITARLTAEDTAEHHNLWRALRDLRVIVLGLVWFGIATAAFGYQLWLPQIVRAMGFSDLATGMVVALPFTASMVAMILWGRSSDARGERVWHTVLPVLIASAGFASASLAYSDLLVLASLYVVVISLFASYGPFLSLPSSFLGGPAAAAGIALVLTIGNLGGFVGPYIIGVLKESTGSYSASMAMLAVVLIISAAVVLALGRALAPRPAMVMPKTEEAA